MDAQKLPGVLVSRNIVSKSRKEGFIESFGSAAHLWMIQCRCQSFTVEGAHFSKRLAKKSDTIVGKHVR